LSRLRHHLAALALQKDFDLRCLAIVNELRASRRLEPLGHAYQQSSRQRLTLAYTAEPFEYPRRDWHSSVRFVGPGLWDAPHFAQPEWLLELDDRPIVLVCTSSAIQEDSALVAATIAGLSQTRFQVVATVPSGFAPAPLPANARVARYIPHQLLLPRTACVVCHAGFGITQKALAAAVPVVACPFGRDQFEVARRVELAGAGTRVLPWQLTPTRIRAAVETAIDCKRGALRIADAFRRAGGARAAADAVEDLLHISGTASSGVVTTPPAMPLSAARGDRGELGQLPRGARQPT
jgi:MGT family glycosyltransferase